MQFSRLTMLGVILAAALSNPLLAAEIGTAFTYQGVLENPPGQVVNDTCAFEFALCDDASAACAPGTVSSHPGIEVTYGVFTVPDVDFGASAFTGEARWMEIDVKCSGDVDFVALSPRVELTPAPYSIRAGTGVGGPNALNVTPDGDVGLGTTTPVAKLHVAVTGYDGVFVEGDDTGDSRFSMENGGGPHFIFDDDSDAHAFKIESAGGRALAFNTSGPNERMRIDPDGNVGIGTTTPAAQLDVNGAVRATTVEITGGSPLVPSAVGWGENVYDEINVPFDAVVLAAGEGFSLAIRSDGTLAGWGNNSQEQTEVPAGTFIAVAVGDNHSLGIRTDGSLVGWGYNAFGQTNVPSGTFTAVDGGNYHSLAIRSDAPTPNPALRLLVDSATKPGSNTWTIYSDRRLKKNITPLSGALDHLLKLRGVTFHWMDPASQGGITGTQMGLIADEVQRVFPQWVGRDRQGYQTLTVGGFEALTAEALRELRAEKDRELGEKECEIENLKSEISNFKFEISELKEMVKGIQKGNEAARQEGNKDGER